MIRTLTVSLTLFALGLLQVLALLFSILTFSELCFGADHTFDQALTELVGKSDEVKKSQLDFESSEEAYGVSKQGLLPELSGTAKISRQKDHDATNQEARIDSALNIFRFGGDLAGIRAQESRRDATAAALTAQRAIVSFEKGRLILDVLAAEQAVLAQKKVLRLKKSGLDTTERLFKTGVRPSQDVEKLTLDFLSEEERLKNLTLVYETSVALLRQDIGQLTIVGGWPWSEKLRVMKTENLNDFFSMTKIPEVKKAELNLLTKEGQISEKRSLLLPRIDLEGQYFWNKELSEKTWQPGWTAALVLRLPLYQKGVDYFGLHEVERDLSRANIELTDSKKRAQIKFDAALQRLKVATSSLTSRELLTKRAQKIYEQSMAAFGRGLMGANELLDDQTRLVLAEKDSSDTMLGAHTAFLGFCESVGLELKTCIDKASTP